MSDVWKFGKLSREKRGVFLYIKNGQLSGTVPKGYSMGMEAFDEMPNAH